MSTIESVISRDGEGDNTPRKSPVPVLGEGFTEKTPTGASQSTEDDEPSQEEAVEKDLKTGKRKFWNFGKKKDIKSVKKTDTNKSMPPSLRSISPMASPGQRASSPQLQQAFVPASPGRNARSSSPGLISPASSQIFERNVQEDVAVTATASPAIPSHITTENHIPPVLDASSMAITDDHLTPDTVEIVTHAAHQPAAVTVTGAAQPSETPLSPLSDDGSHYPADEEDKASTYGALDSADVRRLSFISFADVVHAEQAATDHGSVRDSLLISGASSVISPVPGPRSPSPIRSPISPPLSSSMSGSPKLTGVESSPGRSAKAIPGSPRIGQTGSPPNVSGELAIETMRSALRKTGSGDLSGARGSVGGLETDASGELNTLK